MRIDGSMCTGGILCVSLGFVSATNQLLPVVLFFSIFVVCSTHRSLPLQVCPFTPDSENRDDEVSASGFATVCSSQNYCFSISRYGAGFEVIPETCPILGFSNLRQDCIKVEHSCISNFLVYFCHRAILEYGKIAREQQDPQDLGGSVGIMFIP